MAARILLFLDHKENSRLLGNLLSKRYEVVMADGDDALNGAFDLCIIDGMALDRLWSKVQERKRREDPVFVPFLLITSRQDVNMVTRHLWKTVDEIILMPIEKVELQARVEILLRARTFSFESEHRYYTLAQQSPVGIVILRGGTVAYANPAYANIIGTHPDEPPSSDFFQLIHPDDRSTAREYLCSMLSTRKRTDSLEVRMMAGHEVVWTLLCTSVINYHGKTALLGIVEDISDRVRAGEELTDARGKAERRAKELDAVFAALNNAMVVFDSLGNAIKATPLAAWLFGFDPVGADKNTLLKSLSFSRQDGEPIRTVDLFWNRALQGETILNQRVILTNSKGRRFVVLTSAAPIFVSGEPFGAVCILHDMTEQEELVKQVKDYAQEVAQANEKLQIYANELLAQREALRKAHDELEIRIRERTAELYRSNQALQEFASIASHDMKEPLRKVMAFGDMLKMRYGDALGREGKDYIDRMLNAADRMQGLITSLLDYSRITTQAKPFVSVPLNALLNEVLSDLEVSIARNGGKVEVGELPVIQADPHQMRQLFQNLVSNALKFHKEDEKPRLKVHGQCLEERQRCEIFVEDNGIGFSEEYLDRIFQPFQRLHGRAEYEGAGMGLAICRKIVERHGGSITARSVPGEGTTFIITLPLEQG